MEEKEYAGAVRALAHDDKRPVTARIRDIIDDIESALAGGATRRQIVATLNKNGFAVTESVFYKALTRIQNERKTAAEKSAPVPSGRAETTPPETQKEKDKETKVVTQDKPKKEIDSRALLSSMESKRKPFSPIPDVAELMKLSDSAIKEKDDKK